MNTINSSAHELTLRVSRSHFLHAIAVLLTALLSQSAVAATDAQQVVYALNQELAHVATDNATVSDPGTTRLQRLEQVASRHADFAYTARLVLGDAWQHASERQRERFTDVFRTLMIGTFAEQMMRNAKVTTVIGSPRLSDLDRTAEVRTRIRSTTGAEEEVLYRLRNTGVGWKLFDISISGVGLVNIYAGAIRARMQTLDLDGLIAELAQRNRALSKV